MSAAASRDGAARSGEPGPALVAPAPAAAAAAPEPPSPQPKRTPYRVAFALTAALLLGLVVTLPFSLASLLDDLVGTPAGKVLPLSSPAQDAEAAEHARLHIAATGLDEQSLSLAMRVSGHFICPTGGCDSEYRLRLVSVTPEDAAAEGPPPSVIVNLPRDGQAFSQNVDLPLLGVPIHYPFDRYRATIGVVVQRIAADGSVETLSPEDARSRLFMTIQELLPRQEMTPPDPVDAATLRTDGAPFSYAYGFSVDFGRPMYLRALAVLLVLLVAAAAAYTVFLRPLNDLIVNSGALVLGVWGIRAILAPASVTFITAIDLALSLVIIFLLGAISFRALFYMHDEGELEVLRRKPKSPNDP
jgi:hypothetical protein